MICIPLSKGQHAIIDNDDWEAVSKYKWFARIPPNQKNEFKRVYVTGRLIAPGKAKYISLHRLITGCEKGLVVDHIDGNPLNNIKTNLRICSQAENSRNSRMKHTNKYGLKGVYFYKRKGKYAASIKENGKSKHLGYFLTPEDAHNAYCIAAKSIHGEFHRLA